MPAVKVLQGMTDNLPSIDGILVEVSTITTNPDGPEAGEVITCLTSRGICWPISWARSSVCWTSKPPSFELLFLLSGSPTPQRPPLE
jgi:hypothetical protein